MVDGIYLRQRPLDLKHYNHIAVVGVGGVGSWVALGVALGGLANRITIIDPDIIELHNLNRTPFTSDMVGMRKVDAVALLIEERRDDVDVEPIAAKFADALTEIEDAEGIIDCTDHPMTQEEIRRYAKDTGKIYIRGGYDGMEYTIESGYNAPPKWGDGSGYTVIPSWIGTPLFVASLILTAVATGTFPPYISGNVTALIRGDTNGDGKECVG